MLWAHYKSQALGVISLNLISQKYNYQVKQHKHIYGPWYKLFFSYGARLQED